MNNNEWILFNTIAYKIVSMEPFDTMRLEMMKQLKNLIDFDASSFYIVSSKQENSLEAPVGIAYPKEDMLDYIHRIKQFDYSDALTFSGKNMVYRESDLIAEEARVQSRYYREVYAKMGWHFSLHLNISYREQLLGVVSFFRKKGKPDFVYEDIFILDMLKDYLAHRLYQEWKKKKRKKLGVAECSQKYGLSPREATVLQYLLTEETIEQAAEELHISIHTFRRHISNIYKKIGINSRVQLFDICQK